MNKSEFCDVGEGKCPLQHLRSLKIPETRESWLCSRVSGCDKGAAADEEVAGPGQEGLSKALGLIPWVSRDIGGLEARGSSGLIPVFEELCVCCAQDESKEARGR